MAVSDWHYDYRPSIDRDTEEETLRRWRREGLVLEDKKDRRKLIAWIVGAFVLAGTVAALVWL